MRVVLLFAFTLIWISACLGCGTVPRPELPTRQLAVELEAETVALVRLVDDDGNDAENGKPRSYCAGVWVSPSVIVTAEHCVAMLGMDPERRMMHALGLDDDEPRWNPVGQKAHFSTQGELTNDGGDYWTGQVLTDDPDDDLGAIRVDPPMVPHLYARLSEDTISVGDRLEFVGHPLGNVWSYAEGYVSATRPDMKNVQGHPMLTLQVAAPLTFGNSGGGAFDRYGRLVGISSYLSERMPGMAFCVHRDAVRRFLGAAGVL